MDPKPSFLCHHRNHQFYLGIVRCTEFSYNTVEILKAFFVEVEGHLEQTFFFFGRKMALKEQSQHKIPSRHKSFALLLSHNFSECVCAFSSL